MINNLKRSILQIVYKLSEKLNIRTDLILHFIVSLMISSFFSLILNGSWLALIITLVIGIAKEIYDIFKPKPTGFDLLDLLADSLGCLIGYLSIILLL